MKLDSAEYQRFWLVPAKTHGNFMLPFHEDHNQIYLAAGISSFSGCFLPVDDPAIQEISYCMGDRWNRLAACR
jgi:hypothetical protein